MQQYKTLFSLDMDYEFTNLKLQAVDVHTYLFRYDLVTNLNDFLYLKQTMTLTACLKLCT